MTRARILAALTAVTAALATLAAAPAASAGAVSCTASSAFTESVTATSVTYYLAAPDKVHSGSVPELKTTANSTTAFLHCDAAGQQAVALEYAYGGTTYALGNTIADANHVYFEPVPSAGPLLSQFWAWSEPVPGGPYTFRDLKSGRYLRVPNSGPAPYATVVAGASQTQWTQAPAVALSAFRAPSASQACQNVQGGACGSQQLATLALDLAVPVRNGPGSRLEVKAASTGNGTTDWMSDPPPDQPLTGSSTLEFSPGGHKSGLCWERSGRWVILAKCDPASWAQQVITEENTTLPGYRMRFRGTSLYISGPNHYAPYRELVDIPADGLAGQNWTFEG